MTHSMELSIGQSHQLRLAQRTGLMPGFVPSSTRLSFVAQEGKVHVSFLYERAGGVRSVGYTSSVDGGKSWTGLEDVAGAR